MFSEHRKKERRDFTYYMKVTEAATGNLVGYLADISTDGFKLDCEKPIPLGRNFRLHLDLSGDVANKSSMVFTARSMWSQPDEYNPNAFKVGFQVVAMGPGDAAIFQRMFEKYASSRPNCKQNYGSIRQ